ncbi:MAG TPA: hypothetical protein VFM54_23515 [Micromonosporaceae bacterium]|nr:hypothetical protein [Micromonosporaceae bacterium]
MTATDLIDCATVDTGLEPDPLLAVTVDLVPGMRVWVDRHIGDVPMMGVVTGRAHLVVSLGVGHEAGHRVWRPGTVVERHNGEVWWWTWAGGRGNATLAAALDGVVDVEGRPDNHRLRLRPDTDPTALHAALDRVAGDVLPPPLVAEEAVRELKFAEILPPHLATRTLAERVGDEAAARLTAEAPVRWCTPL